MWLHRKKKKGEYVGGPAPTADSTDSEQKAKPPLPPREETIKSGSKKVMQFGARVQRHGMGSVLSVDSNFPAKELSQVEETKQRLFPSQPPLSVPPLCKCFNKNNWKDFIYLKYNFLTWNIISSALELISGIMYNNMYHKLNAN